MTSSQCRVVTEKAKQEFPELELTKAWQKGGGVKTAEQRVLMFLP